MRFRTFTAALSIVIVGVLGLGACSGDGAQSAQTGGSEEAPQVNRDPSFALPSIKGAFGEAPTMVPLDTDPPTEVVSKLLEPGDGAVVGADSIITVDYAGFLWDGLAFDSSFSREVPSTFSLNEVVTGWKYGLTGNHEGDRVLLIIPPEYGYGDAGQGAIPGGATLVFVVDIKQVLSADLDSLKEAELTENPLPDGVRVEGELGSAPVISFEDGSDAPPDTVEVLVAEGKGPAVTDTDTVVYHFTGTYWDTPNSTNSTWATAPTTLSAANSLFLGYTVGSRIAFVFPAETEGEPAMVMIVDIIAAY